ncbi:MAG: hypothetical protein U9Q69_03900 [Nanoarchaeota archaeon]|nr:hypothetical protein [Nanoarchaeota archaeon]
MKLMKILGAMLLALVALVGMATAADYAISSLEVNGVSPSGSLHVEPGQKLIIDCNILGLSSAFRDVRLEAWIDGYDWGSIRAEDSGVFRVINGVTYSKQLTLDLPSDLDTGDNGYTLRVRLSDRNDSVERTFSLFVEEPMHNLQIQDVMVSKAGNQIYVKVRVENMGYSKEEDIRVTASLPELGVSAKTYIDELYARNEDDNSESSSTLFLAIPDGVVSGTYELNVKLSNNGGNTNYYGTRLIDISGVSENNAGEDALVSFDLTSEMKLGEETTFKVLVANMGKVSKVYTLEFSSMESWADSKAMPSLLSVAKGSTGEFLLKVTPNEEGSHQLTVKVKENNLLVSEKNMTVNVSEKNTSWSWLWIPVGILLVVLIVLVVLAQTQGEKIRPDDFEAEKY